MHCSRRLIVQTLVFSRSYLQRQVSPPETPVVKGGITWARNGRWILSENVRLPLNIQGSFTCRKSTTWNKRLYFASEGRRAEDFSALKNPTSSAGFAPANLGTKGQHSTSRPPKPLYHTLNTVHLQNVKKNGLILCSQSIAVDSGFHATYIHFFQQLKFYTSWYWMFVLPNAKILQETIILLIILKL